MMETFNKEQKAEVEKVLQKIGQEEKVNMKARLRRIGTSKYSGIGSKVADTVGSRLVRSREGDYKTLEIGSIHGRAIGGRGMDLAILLAEGKPEGKPVRDPPQAGLYSLNPRPKEVWFGGNDPSFRPPTFAYPIKPGYVSKERPPEEAFLVRGMENIERKIQEKIVDGIVAGWDNTASIVNKRKGRQDRKRFAAYIKTVSRR